MQRIKTFLSVASCVICLGATSMVDAATIAPQGVSFSAPGTMTMTSSDFFNVPISCNVNISGIVAGDGSKALISNVAFSGSNALCNVPKAQNLPWELEFSSVNAGIIRNVSLKLLRDCSPGPVTINVTWSNATNTLSIPSVQSVGNCKITTLIARPTPAFTVSP